ncbi:VOC family protein [Klebsiella variicola]|uniref:VOC family protein n=1 Tax=Klebsiella variicola TaxID=244366 RepID=UPI0015EAA55B|nr:VOC family protein [Klebsiella variicola]
MPIFSPPTNSSSPFASIRGDHAGVRVPDLDAALAWYAEKLDFRLTASTQGAGLTWAFMAPANDHSFQIELAAGPGAVDRPANSELRDSLGVHGWHHVCLRVDDLDHALAELRLRGVKIVAGPIDFQEIHCRSVFFEDPWGNLFELTQRGIS